ncbi:MAG: GGDEF domain-containing protein [Aquabacterium sp.]
MQSLLSERSTPLATPAGRALLAVGVATPCLLGLFVAHAWALLDTRIREGVNADVLWALQAILLVAVVINVMAGLRLWRARAQDESFPGWVLLVCLGIGISFTAEAIAAGIFTSGIAPVLLGVLAVGLLLFELRPMVICYVVCLLGLLGHDLGLQLGWWPYAPVLGPSAFVGGEPSWWFAAWRQGVFVAGFTVLIGLLLYAFAMLDRANLQLAHLSYTDGLTGLANRRRFMEVLGVEVARQARTGQPLCLVLIDADHFKQVNDAYGHHAGDAVLRMIGRLMKRCIRNPIDLACRLGGEEFALILPDTHLAQAQAVCERLRDQLAVQRFREGRVSFRVSVSMGVVQGRGVDVHALMTQADAQLYRAKGAGRDRICGAEAQQPQEAQR